MKLVALDDLPNHVQKGDEFEENAILGSVLIQAGVAREIAGPAVPITRRPYTRRHQRPSE